MKYRVEVIKDGILSGETKWLSRGITLIESQLPEESESASELIEMLPVPSEKSLRIGITGIPGVGKSTFIEALGMHLVGENIKVAVLTVDPSSARTHGSILGDKTRMQELSQSAHAFIRPSPAGDQLGGVTGSTRESILLCEAAGYEVIIVETVGVGQSETMVRSMVDFFLLLMLPGSGDELQGIKRGVMEMVDGIFINKSDCDPERAKRARTDFENALHLFPPSESDWKVPVEIGSALNGRGIKDIWDHVLAFQEHTGANGWFLKNRESQRLDWFHSMVLRRIQQEYLLSPGNQKKIKRAEEAVSSAQVSVRRAVNDLFA